jgi:hypothetical protein
MPNHQSKPTETDDGFRSASTDCESAARSLKVDNIDNKRAIDTASTAVH